MRKVVVICFLSCFLLLISPCVNSIEYQNQKNIITSGIETNDYSSFVKMLKKIQKDKQRALPRDAIQDVHPDGVICFVLMYLWFWSWVLDGYLPLKLITDIIFRFAEKLGCRFANPPSSRFSINYNAPCTSCALED
jgi:hypothetical protein